MSDDEQLSRTPPKAVRVRLRSEVAFGCPVYGCDNPYLEYHHFDPPWRVKQHHDVTGMIALCAEHHRKADTGAFTIAQLRALKAAAPRPISGRFDWLRRDLLAVVGGCGYYETPRIVVSRSRGPLIWFSRDVDGYLLLNVRMPTLTPEARLQLDENDWLLLGQPSEFDCPPNGRRIHAVYPGGDRLTIEYLELDSVDSGIARYDLNERLWTKVSFPLTVVEVAAEIGGTPYGFTPTSTNLPGVSIRGAVSVRSAIGMSIP